MSSIHACLKFNNFLTFKHSNNYCISINKKHKSFLVNKYASNLHFQIIRNLCSNASTDHQLKKHYDVIIVGGGVFGCSMLYHLVKDNVTNVALIERAQLTSGTTWHTGGLVWRLRPNDTEIQLLNYTRWLMKNLEKETGQPSGWEENGGVFIASNAERLKEYQRLQTLGKFFDVQSYMLRPSELSDVHCLIDPSQVFGALYSPGDGGVDPNTYCNALVGWAKTRGAQLFENTSVKSILTAPNDEQQHVMTHTSSRIKGVRLLMDDGATAKQSHDVTCDALVNACGVWAPDLANTCSSRGDHVITVPQTAFLHSYVVSEPIFEPGGLNLLPKFQPYAFGRHFPKNGNSAKITPLDKPVPNVRDHDRSVYIKLQGRQVLAFGGYEQNPIAVQTNGILFAQKNNFSIDEKKIEISTTKDSSEKSADDFLEKSADTLSQQPFHLFELDWTVFEPNLRASLELMPALKHTGIKSTVCGYESFTPDHKPLIGADINVAGYFHGSGFNSSGIMLSGGCAQQLAQLIARGSTTLDISHLDVRRFNKRYANNRRWILERSHEAYAKNYSIVFPYDEPLAGRNIRQSPLYKALLHRGCIYQERGGWERPGWFLAPQYKTALFSTQTQTNNTKDENIKDKTETTMGTSPSLLQQGDFPTLAYDYYGAYPDISTVHKHYPYARALEMDYTFEFPKHHTTVLRDECLACRQSVAIFDMSYFGKFYLAPTKQTKECYDKVSQLVDWLFCTRIPTTTYSRDKYKNFKLSTNNSNKTKPESLTTKNTFYTCALNAHGGIEADLTVSVLFNENFNGQNTDIITSKLNSNNNNKNSTKTESNINLDSKTKSKDLGNFQKQEHQHHHSIQLGCEPKDAMYYLAVGGGLAQHFETHVQRVITSLGFEPYVKLIDKTDDMGLISVQGPESRTVLQLLVSIDLSNKTFPPGFHATAMFSGDDLAGKPIPVRMVRVSFVGEMGWELHADAKDCVTIYEQIHSHAYKLGIPLRDAGYRALDSLSLEKGYYHWHSEIRTEDSPFEANLSFLCNKMKGGPHNLDDKNKNSTDFLGKTALLTYRARDKMTKKLVFFALSDNKVPLFGLETIWRNGTECCGFLRRAGYGYYMDKSIGAGYIYHPNYRPIDGVLTTQMNNLSMEANKHENNLENTSTNHIKQPMSIEEYIESALFYEIESFGKRYRAQWYKKSPFDTKNDRINGIYQ